MSSVANHQHKRLVRAIDLTDRHMGRLARIGNVEGVLAAVMTGLTRVDVVLIVGGSRAIFPLDHDAHVEVGPTTTKEHR